LLDEGIPLHLTNADPLTKTVTLLGKISGQHAILSLEKTAFDVSNDTLTAIVSRDMSPLVSVVQRNDIYHWYLASMAPGNFGMKATIIYPATETHIRKHEKQRRRMVRETPEIYKNNIESYIETMKGSRLQWYKIHLRLIVRLYNVIEHKAEKERIIYEDPDPESGFLLLPDLYVLGFC
jgi:m7GpppX diphosphatase